VVETTGAAGPDPAAKTPSFTDVTDDSGLDFVHETGAGDRLHMPPVMAGGAALLDFDGDGDLDAYLTNGSHELSSADATTRPTNRLFRREADGSYVDVTSTSGLGDPGYGMGVAVADVDNDGDLDVYVANWGRDRLYRNEGNGSFVDVTSAASVDVEGWSSSASFCDFDRDGFLDLYVVRYVDYQSAKRCSAPDGRRDFCGPGAFPPVHDVVLRNQGDGTFRDVSRASGIASTAAAGLGLVCADLDGDGWQDVYVANDADPNQLWVNLGAGAGGIAFRDDSLILGAAYNLHGQAQAGMGIVAEDLDGDGTLDLFLSHLTNEANTLYTNLGGGAGFRDTSGVSGLGPSSMPFTGFGIAALDAELDGDLDLFVANGKVNVARPVPGSGYPAPWDTLPEPNLLYLNDGAGRFTRVDEPMEAVDPRPRISRGVASGDLDGDGDVDLLIANLVDRARLYRNDAAPAGHWLAVRALDSRLRRDALGVRVTLVTGSRRAVRDVTFSSGYMSSHSPWVHFGVGQAREIDRIEVRWPDGTRETFPGGAVDRRITLFRGGSVHGDG
jgi:hypothetical protein